jgi:uncharacterized protein DUF6745
MIDKLTTAQRERLAAVKQEWTGIGLSCEPANYSAGEEVIAKYYAKMKLPRPTFVRLSSPAACELAANVWLNSSLPKDLAKLVKGKEFKVPAVKEGKEFSLNMADELASKLNARLYEDGVCKQMEKKFMDEMLDELVGGVGGKLRLVSIPLQDTLEKQANEKKKLQAFKLDAAHLRSDSHSRATLLNRVVAALVHKFAGRSISAARINELTSNLKFDTQPMFVANRWGAGHWSGWEAFYAFIREIGVKFDDPDEEALTDWMTLSKNIGWWGPWPGVCFVSDRTEEVNFDAEGRLHAENGPAVKYRDGWGVYYLHGVEVPGEWLEDRKQLTAKIALTWQNLEQRRVAVELIGWAKILSDPSLKAKIIDEDGDPQIGTLLEVKLPDLERPCRFVKVQCGTGREFAVGVPREVNTALEAQAWMQGKELKEFVRPEVRT